MKYIFLTLFSFSFVVQAIEYDTYKVRTSANDLIEAIDSYWSRDFGDWLQKQEDMKEVRSLAYKFEKCADRFWDSDKRLCMKSFKRDIDTFEKKLSKFHRNKKINIKISHFLFHLRSQANGSLGTDLQYYAQDLIESINDCTPRNMRDFNQQKHDIHCIRSLVDSFDRCQNKAWDFEKDSCLSSLRRDIDYFEKKLDTFDHNHRISAKIRDFLHRLRAQSF